jgi:hypothetical protein
MHRELTKRINLMKDAIVFVLISILIISLAACHSYVDLTNLKEFEANQAKPRIYVIQLQTVQQETISFSEKFPGRMLKNEVVGIQQVLLYEFNSDSVIYKGKRSLTPLFAVKNGVNNRVINQDGKSLVCNASDTIRIPFSNITQMHIKKIDQANSLLLFGGVVVGAAGLIYLIVSNLTFDLGIGM